MHSISHRFFVSILLLISFQVYGEKLSLPRQFNSDAIFYLKSKQLDRFSCGYNVLFNAANLEHYYGFSNTAYKYGIFEQKCMRYLEDKGYNPKANSTNKMTEFLARHILHLQPFYHIHFDDINPREIVFIFSTPTRINFRGRLSGREKDRLFSKARTKRSYEEIESIKSHLVSKDMAVVHFLCYVNSSRGRHGILISLCKNHTGRALYIFDNMNRPISPRSEITTFIDYLKKTFNVSSKETFVGPKLPHRWPYLDRSARS